MFGGNSNWRGPIWMPVNTLIIRALLNFYLYYGDNFKIECPTGSGKLMNLFEVSNEISDRLTRIFLRDDHGRRPVYGGTKKFQQDPHWRDYISFTNTFTAIMAPDWERVIKPVGPVSSPSMMRMFSSTTAERALELGKMAAFIETAAIARGAKAKVAATTT